MTAQSPGGATATFYGWTTIQLILMALGAAVVIAAMIYGRRLAHQRHRAERAARERADEAGIDLPPSVDPAAVEADAGPVARQPDPVITPEAAPAPTAASLPAPAPAEVPAPPPPSPAPAPAIALPLTTIKGLGPKVAAILAERGITRVDQVATLTPDQARDLDVQLGAFTGRMARDRWIEQARLLASGDTAGYEAEFGRLG